MSLCGQRNEYPIALYGLCPVSRFRTRHDCSLHVVRRDTTSGDRSAPKHRKQSNGSGHRAVLRVAHMQAMSGPHVARVAAPRKRVAHAKFAVIGSMSFHLLSRHVIACRALVC